MSPCCMSGEAEGDKGWLFPVGDEVHELGYVHMFADMFDALDEGRAPMETFFDGYVVNAVIDACYRSAASKKWEPIKLEKWLAATKEDRGASKVRPAEDGYVLIKEERMPDGRTKRILKNPSTGEIVQRIK